MTSGRPGGLPASIRQRLLNLSRERRESFQRVLDRFALERGVRGLGAPDGGQLCPVHAEIALAR